MEKLSGAPSILDVHNKINELVDAQNAEVPVEVPTKVSDLENDAGYITASVNTLANYYTKGETYTKTEVDGKITELNEDLGDKLDKRTQTTEYAQVYIKTAQGTQSVYDLRSDFAGNSVVLRDSVGAVNTAEPNSASNATTKNYVDGLVSDLSADITTLQSTVLKNSGNQTLNGNLTVTGNTVVQGNLTVQGTTITKDAESLVVQDNVIVTNSNGTTLTDLSGLFIKTGATGGYAVVYDPTKDAVILGEGTIDGSNVVTIQASERKAIVTRQDGDTFTDKNIVMWDAEHNGLVDSGMTRSMIALRGSANTFSALQTFSAGISVSGSIVFGEHTLSAPIGDGQIARMSDIPTKLPNPAALTFGTTTYDGSAARTITADSLGALTQATADGLYQSRGNYLTSIPTASSTVLGGVKSATTGTTAGRDYRVQVNTDGTMKVNVPWTDNNTVTNIGANGSGYTSGNINFVGSGATSVSKSGSTVTISSTNTTYSTFNRSSNGLVPTPGGSTTTRYLREDGTWQVPPDTNTKVTQTYSATNANYPILLKSSVGIGAGSVTASTLFNANVYVNPSTGTLTASRVYGAVFNDYAEYRLCLEDILPGHIVVEDDNLDIVRLCNQRNPKKKMFVVSDTYGYCMGDSKNSVPISLSGRVLVCFNGNRDKLRVGDYLGCDKDGKARKISRLRAFFNPRAVLGRVSHIPQADDIWGTNNTEVNGRIWVNL